MPKTFRRLLTALMALALVAALSLGLAACGDDDEDAGSAGETAEATSTAPAGPTGEPISIGYSAWPGWFPWAIAEEKGYFEEEGLDVELEYFADYTASLDALAAGKLDGNSQTLNDTMASVAAGSDQVIVVVNDNSAGNDAIIVDEGIDSIQDLKGKTVAAEAGVVDHFLLLQGLASEGLTEDDIDFRGVPTDAAAASFAGGEFDAVGVFAPFTVEALKRPGSKVLFDSADFPGTIPDHLVVSREMVESRPGDVQGLVNAWYKAYDFIQSDQDAAYAIMAAKAEVSVDEYAEFAGGTRLFSAEEAMEAFGDRDDATSLQYVADQINPFLVESGLAKEEADTSGLFDPSFTQAYLDAEPDAGGTATGATP